MTTNGKRIQTSETADKTKHTNSNSGKRVQSKKPAKVNRSEEPSRFGMGTKRRWRLKGMEWLILFVPVIAAIIAVIAVTLAGRDLMQKELSGKPCQYYAGSIYRFESGALLRRTSDDVTVIEMGGHTTKLNCLPIYDELKEREIVVPQNMLYYAPRSGNSGRVNYFSTVKVEEGGAVMLSREDRRATLEKGFLYDGNDLYLFLEPMTVEFNGYVIELAPLSYVEALYTSEVMVFNYGTGDFMIEIPTGAVKAQSAGGEYTISLLGDSMIDMEGRRTLLGSRPELADSILD